LRTEEKKLKNWIEGKKDTLRRWKKSACLSLKWKKQHCLSILFFYRKLFLFRVALTQINELFSLLKNLFYYTSMFSYSAYFGKVLKLIEKIAKFQSRFQLRFQLRFYFLVLPRHTTFTRKQGGRKIPSTTRVKVLSHNIKGHFNTLLALLRAHSSYY